MKTSTIVIIIVAILIIAGGAWWYMQTNTPAASPSNATQTNTDTGGQDYTPPAGDLYPTPSASSSTDVGAGTDVNVQ